MSYSPGNLSRRAMPMRRFSARAARLWHRRPGHRGGSPMPKMQVAQIPHAKGPFELVERDIPEPIPGSVRVKVAACGVCHSDSITKEGLFPGIAYPRVPGHEIIGTIDAVGAGVAGW